MPPTLSNVDSVIVCSSQEDHLCLSLPSESQVAIMFLLLHLQNADANTILFREWQNTIIQDSMNVINLADYFYCWGES